MSYRLRELGLRPGEPGLYEGILAAVEDGRLGQQEVTKGFVLELKEQVEVMQGRFGFRQPGTNSTVPSEKLSIKEFCHVIGRLAEPEKFKDLTDVSKKFARKIWRKEELEALEESVRANPEQELAIWEPFLEMLPDQGAALVARGEDPAGEDPGGEDPADAAAGEEEQARYA
jgi:hypothetical protein